MKKKLVYVQHLQAWDQAQKDAQEGEDPIDGVDPSQIAENYGGMENLPSDIKGQMGDLGGMGGQSQPSAGSQKTAHPAISQYENRINVQNPGEDMGWERRDEIMHGPDDPDQEPAPDPDVTVDTSRDRDRIDQASDE